MTPLSIKGHTAGRLHGSLTITVGLKQILLCRSETVTHHDSLPSWVLEIRSACSSYSFRVSNRLAQIILEWFVVVEGNDAPPLPPPPSAPNPCPPPPTPPFKTSFSPSSCRGVQHSTVVDLSVVTVYVTPGRKYNEQTPLFCQDCNDCTPCLADLPLDQTLHDKDEDVVIKD